METLPLLLILGYALYGGLTHAFEADHVLAVSNLVSQRNSVWTALKDGVYWGLGHTSTICLVGILMIIFKMNISEGVFAYFEAGVGAMLIVIASYRVFKYYQAKRPTTSQSEKKAKNDSYKTAYSIGTVHGLAGSGALIVLVMAQLQSMTHSLLYLIVFGLGSVVGMVLIAGLFSIPFSQKLIHSNLFKTALIFTSSSLCFTYGCYSIYINLIV